MIRPLLKPGPGAETWLYLVPETRLEEKFVIHFSFENGLASDRVQGRESLRLPAGNDDSQAVENVRLAFERFCRRFGYVEVPDLRGLDLTEAADVVRDLGLAWTIHGYREEPNYPPGSVISQHPEPGPVSIPEGVVKLVLNQRSAFE